MLLQNLRGRVTDTLVEILTQHGDAAQVARLVERIQKARTKVEEVEGAVLHFWLLPARDDLRALRRRVQRLRREVRALESEIARLEALVSEDDR